MEKASLNDQKWFFYGILMKTSIGTFVFKSVEEPFWVPQRT